MLQGGRYALVGVSVALLYFVVTTVMRTVIGVPWAVAIAVGYLCATVVHFTLQRTVVFRNDGGFALSMRQQAARFLVVVVFQYLVTVGAMSVLPDLLGLPGLLVYAGLVCTVPVGTFLVMRTRLFHPAPIQH